MALALAGCALTLLLAAAEPASAAPPQLWQTCETGSGAGQCIIPRGIAADPRNGRVFVADQVNRRIVEFNPLGQFVKAWGWGVDSGAAEMEICTEASGCQQGSIGSGAGQSSGTQGLAVDSAGNVFANDRNNRRVQKFDPSGNFQLMFGGEVNKTTGANVCTKADLEGGEECGAGIAGSGNGQFGDPNWAVGDFVTVDRNGTATDADDIVYVGDVNRIQSFDVAGVYQGQCATPVPGSVQSLASDSEGNLYAIIGAVDSGSQLRKLSPTCEQLLPSPGEEPPAFEFPKQNEFDKPQVSAVTVDAAGHVYLAAPVIVSGSGTPRDPICEFGPTGKLIECFGKGQFSSQSTGLEANLCSGQEAPGSLYVSNTSSSDAFVRAYGTASDTCFNARTLPATNVEETTATLNGTVNPKGSLSSECRFEYGTTTTYGSTVPCVQSPAQIGAGSEPVAVHADLSGLEKGTVYLFRLRATVAGTPEIGSDEAFKTKGPPVISGDRTLDALYTEATVRAVINPEGFASTYRIEYVDQASFEAEGFANPSIGAETAIGSDRTGHPVIVILAGLAPGTTYHWRIVAANSSGTTVGEGHTVTTYRIFVPDTDCPNQPLRSGDSAYLPDCRAYEMVSPVDKNGTDITSGLTESNEPQDAGGRFQASTDGNSMTYTARYASFCDQPGHLGFNQYLAVRGAGVGWSCEGINVPSAGGPSAPEIFGFNRSYMVFTPDLCNGWLHDTQTPAASPEGQDGYYNLYRRDNCGAGAGQLEALVSEPLPPGTQAEYVDKRSVQGVSEDGRHAFFVTPTKLNEDAHPDEPGGPDNQIYHRFEGKNSLVSVLPGGIAATASAEVGAGAYFSRDGAVSADGSRVYWSASVGSGGGEAAKLYLRTNPEQGIVKGECTKPTKACTRLVGESSGSASLLFWQGSPDGSRALYSEGSIDASTAKLYEFDLGRAEAGEEASRLIAAGTQGVAGASRDLSRVYFLSTAVLAGAGENSEGAEAVAGQPNLYLAEGGGFAFIATLIAPDLGQREPGVGGNPAYDVRSPVPIRRATRVSADGSRIAFQSRAPLTDYDNTDTPSGKAAVEVFSYEAGGALHCVSCNPSGARPVGVRELRDAYVSPVETVGETKVRAAAWIPTWEHPGHASRAVSEDGSRIFFNANDALLPRDTNGAPDVYEWEEAGHGSCEEADADYFPQNGGCLYLISSGENPDESVFREASPDGRDVFFTTTTGLLPQDPGSIDLYDARAGGGIPQPAARPHCEGEACQSPPAPPEDATPASTSFQGAGNVREGSPKRRCPKGKRKVKRRGKVRCAKKRGRRQQRRAKHNRRAGR